MIDKNQFGILAVAFVWFTTHFGGGFASGVQVVQFFVSYGWYAVFLPVLSIAIVTAVLYYAWNFAAVYCTFDYREWGNKYFKPFEAIFSNAYEAMYILILLIASAVAFATGGTVMQQILGTPYVTNTVIVAVCIFFLTIFGADLVRKAASTMAVVIIAAAVGANLVGIYLVGSVAGWERWLAASAGYFLVWRLCLYGATVYGWVWMRRRLLAREEDAQARRRLVRSEIAGVVAIVALEASLLMQS